MPTKLDTARIFERLFEVYRAQFSLFFPAALIVFLPVALLNGAFAAGGGAGLVLLGALLSIVAGFWLQGMVIEAVRDIQDGKRDFTLGGLFQSVMPVLPKLIGVGILTGLGITLGFILLIVPGLILLTWWAVVGPAVVIENRGVDAFGRSRALVRGSGWQVFAVIVVVFLIQIIANAILGAIFGDSFVGQALGSLLSGSLVGPIAAIAAALVYLELRRIHGEGTPHAGADTAPADEAAALGGAPESPSAAAAFGGSREPESSPLGGAAAPESPAGGAPPRPASGDPLGEPAGGAPPRPAGGDPLGEPAGGAPPRPAGGDPLGEPRPDDDPPRPSSDPLR